jgi:hypothetical protein
MKALQNLPLVDPLFERIHSFDEGVNLQRPRPRLLPRDLHDITNQTEADDLIEADEPTETKFVANFSLKRRLQLAN